MAHREKHPSLTRREIVKKALEITGAGVCVALGWSAVGTREAYASWVPRPPGALTGKHFLAACAHCGQCVRACPYGTLKLAGWLDPAPIGTPYFTPSDVPCYMCEDMPCIKACPSGALDPNLDDIANAKMGVAMIDPSSCLSWQGLRCEICFRDCPQQGKAITVEPHPRDISKHAVFVPTIHPQACTGCGLCTKGCPTDKPAINIVNPDDVLGKIGEHYRLGWLSEDDPKNQRDIPNVPEKTDEDMMQTTPGGLDYLNENLL